MNVQNERDSSSDRPESSSSGDNSRSNGGSSGSFEGNEGGGAGDRVPRYVDMVIPDYEEAERRPNLNVLNALEPLPPPPFVANVAASAGGNAELRTEDTDEDNQGTSDSLENSGQDSTEATGKYCQPTEKDVLLSAPPEQGVEHPGNQKYQSVVAHLAKKYKKIKMGYKRAAVQILLNAVKVQGGRFLRADGEGKYKEVSKRKAYQKSSDAIRSTCRNVEVVSASRTSSKRKRRPPGSSAAQRFDAGSEKPYNNSETTLSSDSNQPNKEECNLEILALRLQTGDENLLHIDLDLEKVDHEFIFPFAKALDTSSVLTSMSIRLCHLSRTNANALAWGLQRCRSLHQVKLSFAKITEKAAIILAGVVENESVKSLNLDDCGINIDGLKTLCKMLARSKKNMIERLSLEDNPFGDDGAHVLAKFIGSSDHIRFIAVGGTCIEEQGSAEIRSAIKKRTKILTEVSGLLSLRGRKRAAGISTSESNEDQTNKRRNLGSAPNPATGTTVSNNGSSNPSSSGNGSSGNGSSSQQQGSSTSSSNDTELPQTSCSDNGQDAMNGSDEGPTSSNNESDDAPSSAES